MMPSGCKEDGERDLERERVTVQEAAQRLGITEGAVRKRARKGDLRSEKVVEGNKERLYVFLDREEERVPEPFREKYMRSLEERVKTLEDEVYRQQAIILSMSQSLRALTGGPESPETDAEGVSRERPEGLKLSNPVTEEEGAQEAAQPRSGTSWWRRIFGG
jgi:excisionase family DNA binding protein